MGFTRNTNFGSYMIKAETFWLGSNIFQHPILIVTYNLNNIKKKIIFEVMPIVNIMFFYYTWSVTIMYKINDLMWIDNWNKMYSSLILFNIISLKYVFVILNWTIQILNMIVIIIWLVHKNCLNTLNKHLNFLSICKWLFKL